MNRQTACLGFLLATAALAAPVPSALASGAALRREALTAAIGLAESKDIYLVLDPSAGEIRLEIQNVVLRRFPATLEVGQPRSFDRKPVSWSAMIFTLESGMIELERSLIRPPAKADSTAAPADTTPAPMGREQLLGQRERMLASIPANYTLHFAPDLDVIVLGEQRTGGWQGFWTGAREHWNQVLARIKKQTLPMRIQLVVNTADAKRLGVALRQGMSMLVLPPLAPQGAAEGS